MTLGDLKRASMPYQHEAYRWIFTQNRLGFQRSRVRIMLEIDAFDHILKSWQKLGYPFAELTPSYATAIGASGDRPTSLAELAGIIQNDGVKLPTLQIKGLEFGANTPYETALENAGGPNSRVLSVEVAQMVRGCMTNVVKSGTAIQAAGAFDSLMTVAGKTGTGDHRKRFFGSHGNQTGEVFVDRAACFVFLIGDRFFGTMTVAVLGPGSKDFDFTSSYPVRLFTCLAPDLVSLLDGKPEN
jgi:cell division protein FtsI/penicillin-binding protein 2